ncbi:hypothetical protein H5410_043970 [Solanum commersonii]|uniref:Uncharacterized protein n=1 Tax=Solanum commersonii TaxID=4109 RepID=A0A9J5Y1P8_SOLCO|nr:hypothetical protein H5410_043970 [Solanum commersonii]
MPPATAVNYITWIIVGFLSGYVYRFMPVLWHLKEFFCNLLPIYHPKNWTRKSRIGAVSGELDVSNTQISPKTRDFQPFKREIEDEAIEGSYV